MYLILQLTSKLELLFGLTCRETFLRHPYFCPAMQGSCKVGTVDMYWIHTSKLQVSKMC